MCPLSPPDDVRHHQSNRDEYPAHQPSPGRTPGDAEQAEDGGRNNAAQPAAESEDP